jgi:hypothetical protein
MGEAVEQEMGRRVRKALSLAGFLIPPACREEVLGDLLERNATLARFCVDALRTIPYVIVCRIRRTVDPQLFLMHALVLLLCYWRAAQYADLLRLAILVVIVLLCLLLEDAFAKAGPRSRLHLMRAPLLGFAATFLVRFEGIALPLNIVLYGGAMGLPLILALRLMFSPQSTSRQGPV